MSFDVFQERNQGSLTKIGIIKISVICKLQSRPTLLRVNCSYKSIPNIVSTEKEY